MNRYSNKAERAKNIADFRAGVTSYQSNDTTPYNRGMDKGPLPTSFNLEAKAIENENYRTTLWTGAHLQLTLMSIPVGGEIPLEVHQNEDQMVYIIRGEAQVTVVSKDRDRDLVQQLKSGYCALIPATKQHLIKNTGSRELKLFSVYAPPVHMRGSILL